MITGASLVRVAYVAGLLTCDTLFAHMSCDACACVMVIMNV